MSDLLSKFAKQKMTVPRPPPPAYYTRAGGRNHDSTATVRKSLRCYVQDAYVYEQKSDS